MIEIKSRWTSAVLFRSETATTVNLALVAAVAAGANLSGATLSDAILSGALLSGALLSRALLSRADLRGATFASANGAEVRGIIAVSVSYPAHGECGRQLTLIQDDKSTTYHCGCFRGTRDELVTYIDRGEQKHKRSREIALSVVDMLLVESVRAQGAGVQ